jgi:hypothetical protein
MTKCHRIAILPLVALLLVSEIALRLLKVEQKEIGN